MKNYRLVLTAGLFVVVILGCAPPLTDLDPESIPQTELQRIDHVGRVFLHEYGRYTLLVEETGGTVIQWRFGNQFECNREPNLIADVPKNEPMWAEYYVLLGGMWAADCEQLMSIHLHSAQDINGAGWNHGKFGSGQTTVVE